MLIFIDESGHYRINDPSPFAVLSAVTMENSCRRDFIRTIFNLKRKFWNIKEPHQYEMKGTLLLNDRSLKTSPNPKTDFLDEIFSLCKSNNLVTFATIAPRPVQLSLDAQDYTYLSRLYTYLLERIDKFMEERQPNSIATIVFDSIDDKTNKKISISFGRFLYRSLVGQQFLHISPVPLFANSILEPGIQIADLFAYCINQRFQQRLGIRKHKLIGAYYNMIKDLQFISQDQTLRGIRFIREGKPEETVEE